MKKLILILSLLLPALAWANAGEHMDKAPINGANQASLQRGAKTFVNYCLNCHSAAYMRFNRLHDIGLTDEQIKANLLFNAEKVGETMKVAMDKNEAKKWFGATPPDLTVVARSRVPIGCTPTCAVSTVTRRALPAGTMWRLTRSACRTCCGNCRGSSI